MRNYHLNHPFDNSPAALPWPTDPPETVHRLADLTRSHAKATMQTPAEPPLRDPTSRLCTPTSNPTPPQPHHLPFHPSEGDGEGAHPPPTKPGKQQPPNPPTPPEPPYHHSRHPPSRHYHHPTRTRHPHHPPSRHQHRPYPRLMQGSKKARRSSNPSATTTRATGSGVRAQCSTAPATWETTGGHYLGGLAPSKGPRPRQQRPGQARRPHPGAHERPTHQAPHQRKQGSQRHQIHWGTPPEWSQGLPPPGLPKHPPQGKKWGRPARAHAVGLVLGPHARTDRRRDTRVAEPRLPAPEDGRPGEGQRLTPDAPRNGGRPTTPGTAPHHPRGTQPPQGMQAKGTVLGPHTHTPAPTARGWRTPTARPVGGQSGEGQRLTSDAPHSGGRHPPQGRPSATPTASNAAPQRAHAVGPVLGPHARTDRTRDTRVAEPWPPAAEDGRPGEGQRLTPDAPHNGGRPPPPPGTAPHHPRGTQPPQGMRAKRTGWAPTPTHPRPQHVGGGPRQPAQWVGSRGRDSA